MSKQDLLSADALRSLLDYSPSSGVFSWKEDRGRGMLNKVAGTKMQQGHIAIEIAGVSYYAHRLAWLYVHGTWPTDMVDHVNGVRDDNRLSNLRVGTRSLNVQNQRKPQRNNKSGYLGVTWSPRHKKFAAHIGFSVDGKSRKKRLGYFDSAKEAHDAYLRAKRVMHEGCTI